jgi:hypothetical protein
MGGANFGGVSGGEFRVTFGRLDSSLTSVSSVQWEANAYAYRTFCIELGETLALSDPTKPTSWNSNNVFKVAFSDRSVMGGNVITDNGSDGPGDRISDLSKTIYDDWITNRTGTLRVPMTCSKPCGKKKTDVRRLGMPPRLRM